MEAHSTNGRKESFRLPKTRIIKKAAEFQDVFHNARTFAGKFLVLYVVKRGDQPNRVAFAAGKKLGKAHVRNRLKRMLREVWRLNSHDIVSGYEFILMARKAAVDAKTPELERCFLDVARRCRLLRRKD